MPKPRSPNIFDKPKAKRWVEENDVAHRHFFPTLRFLISRYTDDNHGYMNFTPPEYRFNRGEGYTTVRPNRIRTKVEFRRATDKRDTFTIKNDGDLAELSDYLKANPVPNFDCFQAEIEEKFQRSVENSLQDDEDKRQKRLENAPKTPEEHYVLIRQFRRNPDVVAVVLKHANGKCEICHNDAPFIRSSNDTPYLEVHHKATLANKGEDTIDNSIALCPNCHRERHYGPNKKR